MNTTSSLQEVVTRSSQEYYEHYKNLSVLGDEIATTDYNLDVKISSTNITHLNLTSKSCGFLPFCTSSALSECAEIAVTECSLCNMSHGAIYLTCIIILGLFVITSNMLVIWTCAYEHTKINRTNLFKASLAVSDIIIGCQLLFVVPYNFSWTIHETANGIRLAQDAWRGSRIAITCGYLHVFGFISSLYHLVYFGLFRLYAIQFPFRYKSQSRLSFCIGLVIVWLLAMAASFIPLIFHHDMIFSYLPTLMFYIIEPKHYDVNYIYHASIASIIVFTAVPLFAMTFISIGTYFLAHFKLRREDTVPPTLKNKQNAFYKKEKSMIRTLLLMQAGFTSTTIPQVLAEILFYSSHFDCANVSIPLAGCFFITMCTGLVNVLVYSARENFFQYTVKSILKCKRPPTARMNLRRARTTNSQ